MFFLFVFQKVSLPWLFSNSLLHELVLKAPDWQGDEALGRED